MRGVCVCGREHTEDFRERMLCSDRGKSCDHEVHPLLRRPCPRPPPSSSSFFSFSLLLLFSSFFGLVLSSSSSRAPTAPRVLSFSPLCKSSLRRNKEARAGESKQARSPSACTVLFSSPHTSLSLSLSLTLSRDRANNSTKRRQH